jgi:hypothetical protein
MPTKIVNLVARDIRLPTSQTLTGSDATNKAPDYSAAYVILQANHLDSLESQKQGVAQRVLGVVKTALVGLDPPDGAIALKA